MNRRDGQRGAAAVTNAVTAAAERAADVLAAASGAGSGMGAAAAGRVRGVPGRVRGVPGRVRGVPGRAIAAGEHRLPGAVPTGSPTRPTGAARCATGTGWRAPFSAPGPDASAGGRGRLACPAKPGSGRPPARRPGWSGGGRRCQWTVTSWRRVARAPRTARARGPTWPCRRRDRRTLRWPDRQVPRPARGRPFPRAGRRETRQVLPRVTRATRRRRSLRRRRLLPRRPPGPPVGSCPPGRRPEYAGTSLLEGPARANRHRRWSVRHPVA